METLFRYQMHRVRFVCWFGCMFQGTHCHLGVAWRILIFQNFVGKRARVDSFWFFLSMQTNFRGWRQFPIERTKFILINVCIAHNYCEWTYAASCHYDVLLNHIKDASNVVNVSTSVFVNGGNALFDNVLFGIAVLVSKSAGSIFRLK